MSGIISQKFRSHSYPPFSFLLPQVTIIFILWVVFQYFIYNHYKLNIYTNLLSLLTQKYPFFT